MVAKYIIWFVMVFMLSIFVFSLKKERQITGAWQARLGNENNRTIFHFFLNNTGEIQIQPLNELQEIDSNIERFINFQYKWISEDEAYKRVRRRSQLEDSSFSIKKLYPTISNIQDLVFYSVFVNEREASFFIIDHVNHNLFYRYSAGRATEEPREFRRVYTSLWGIE